MTSAKTVVKEFLTDFLDNLLSRLVQDDISNKIELPGEDVARLVWHKFLKLMIPLRYLETKRRHLVGTISMMSGWIRKRKTKIPITLSSWNFLPKMAVIDHLYASIIQHFQNLHMLLTKTNLSVKLKEGNKKVCKGRFQ